MKTFMLTAVLAAVTTPVLAYDGWGYSSKSSSRSGNCDSYSQNSNLPRTPMDYLGSGYRSTSVYRGNEAYDMPYGYAPNSGCGVNGRNLSNYSTGSAWNNSVRDPWDTPLAARVPTSRNQTFNRFDSSNVGNRTLPNRWTGAGSTYPQSHFNDRFQEFYPGSRY